MKKEIIRRSERMVAIYFEKLFGRFDYEVVLNQEGLTILTGPNGYGKSTILKSIEAIGNEFAGIMFFFSLDFKKITAVFKNDKTIVIEKDKRVIGIRDRDYQQEPTSEKIFFYDYNCMEIMLISNDDIIDNLCFEYYKGPLLSRELRNCILNELKILSVIRKYNETKQWGIILKGLSANQGFNTETEKMDNDVIVRKVNQMNGNFISEQILSDIYDEVSGVWSQEQLYYGTQGHDFCTLFATICNNYRKRGIKPIEVQASARCTFRWSDFVKTKLYLSVKEYSQVHSLKILAGIS